MWNYTNKIIGKTSVSEQLMKHLGKYIKNIVEKFAKKHSKNQ